VEALPLWEAAQARDGGVQFVSKAAGLQPKWSGRAKSRSTVANRPFWRRGWRSPPGHPISASRTTRGGIRSHWTPGRAEFTSKLSHRNRPQWTAARIGTSRPSRLTENGARAAAHASALARRSLPTSMCCTADIRPVVLARREPGRGSGAVRHRSSGKVHRFRQSGRSRSSGVKRSGCDTAREKLSPTRTETEADRTHRHPGSPIQLDCPSMGFPQCGEHARLRHVGPECEDMASHCSSWLEPDPSATRTSVIPVCAAGRATLT